MDILKDIEETREFASVLYDSCSAIDGANLDELITEPVVEQVLTGTRLVLGQVVLLVTRVDGNILTSAPAIVTRLNAYNNVDYKEVEYKLKLILGNNDTIDDISSDVILRGADIEEKVSITVPDTNVNFIKTLTTVTALELKRSLSIKHMFIHNGSNFKSIF